MRLSPFIISYTLLFVVQSATAQKLKKSEKTIVANLQMHIAYLADDKLEGRKAGTAGEKLAMQYISNEFKKIGLEPKGSDGFYQAFDINDGKQINPNTHLIINGNDLKIGSDFFPFVFSPNISIKALPAISVQEADMPWFFDLKETMEENKHNPHFDVIEFIKTKANDFKKKRATALLIYNTSSIDDKLSFNGKDKSDLLDIPVFYLSKAVAKNFLSDESATIDVQLKTDIGEKKRTGYNVIGYINNAATNTVILGAHFDHLGYGEDGNSLFRTGEKQIHNGADDNASGTAALIELARILKNSKQKNNNYLFIAFSGEELGLYGSKYFVEYPTVELKQVNYMINMDMVGRLNDSTNTVTIGGIGTSPEWGHILDLNGKKDFKIKIDSSGTGPSDHTSFYRKDIPVLFFFTGLHPDYHKPSDDADKINIMGEYRLINYIAGVVIKNAAYEKNKLVFTKTRETQTTTFARFSVTMGIMPDYTFSGNGVRADGISEDRPAQKAGLKAGDIIIQLGEYPVSSLENYMQVLGKFKKGDKTKVKYKRGIETLEAEVQF
ncbi:MAG: M20/M25/M40 family metallo-hydrolase [Bacteroidota bacterium]|nr:M20/M25/M40 family metallo-hydrolase [Bacteroidota bacterium]